MIKEPKNVDFYTTGKQPSEADFAKISALIKTSKDAAKRGKKSAQQKKNAA